MLCNWIINIHNCDNDKLLIPLQTVGLIIHIILCLLSFIFLFIQKKYFWKSFLLKDKYGDLYPSPVECILIAFFNLLRTFYMIIKLFIKINNNYWIITLFYNLPWIFINVGTYIFLWWISYCLHEQELMVNFRNFKIIVIVDIILSLFITIPCSIVLGMNINNNLYNIMFIIIHTYWGIMTTIFGLCTLYIMKKVNKLIHTESDIKNKLNKIIPIIYFAILGSLSVGPLWIIFGLLNNYIIYKWNIFSIILFIMWEIQCAPTFNIVLYIVITKKIYNFYKLDKHEIINNVELH
jgi:hypothetical protein